MVFSVSHTMDRPRSLRKDNVDRKIFFCAALRYGSGVESIAPKSKAFRAILAASPVVENRA